MYLTFIRILSRPISLHSTCDRETEKGKKVDCLIKWKITWRKLAYKYYTLLLRLVNRRVHGDRIEITLESAHASCILLQPSASVCLAQGGRSMGWFSNIFYAKEVYTIVLGKNWQYLHIFISAGCHTWLVEQELRQCNGA